MRYQTATDESTISIYWLREYFLYLSVIGLDLSKIMKF